MLSIQGLLATVCTQVIFPIKVLTVHSIKSTNIFQQALQKEQIVYDCSLAAAVWWFKDLRKQRNEELK